MKIFLMRWYLICTRPTRMVWIVIVSAHWHNSPQIKMWF